MKFNPKENYEQLKTYYDAMSARWDSYIKLIKLIVLLSGVLLSGWTAIQKFETDDTIGLGQVPEKVSSLSHDMAAFSKGGGKVHPPHVGKLKKNLEAKLMAIKPTVWQKLSRSILWIVLTILCGYLLFNHSAKHYLRKPKGNDTYV